MKKLWVLSVVSMLSVLLSTQSLSAQNWIQTWGQHPLGVTESAGYASQSNMAALPGYGAFVWENYRDDINVFSDAGFNYQFQHGAVNYPWGIPLWRCATGGWNPNARWVLSAPIDAITTTIATNPSNDVDSGAVWGSGVYLLIDQEILEFVGYDSVNKILTVNRGGLGTTPAPHSNTNGWSGRFGYICQFPIQNGVSLPLSAWPTTSPSIRHPNGDITADPVDNLLYFGGGIHESGGGYDLWSYSPVTGQTNFVTGSVPERSESLILYDSDDKVLMRATGGQNGSPVDQSVWLFCRVANPGVGCVTAGQFNLLTNGKTTTYVSNPASGPQFTAMRGVYDSLHHAFILWGGAGCTSPTQTCHNLTNTSVYIFQSPTGNNTNRWTWTKLPNDGVHQLGNIPLSDWRPSIAWDSLRSRVLVAEPSDGAVFSGVWDGASTFTWTNLNIPAGPLWARFSLQYPYMAYVSEHDALVLAIVGVGNPKSLAAWELSFGGTP